MVKKIVTAPIKATINLRMQAAAAKPNPKMGQALGPLGINMMQICKDVNAATTHIRPDVPLRVILTAYVDRNYSFVIKPPPTTWFLKKASGREKFTEYPGHIYNNQVSIQYIYEIAKIKKDLDPDHKKLPLENICKMIISQCSSIGVLVTPNLLKPQPVKLPIKN